MSKNIFKNKSNKIKLYKDNIIKFIDKLSIDNQIIKKDEIEEIDYIIGILFLTEMNRYCKNNKIIIHGYYISYSLINLFNKIRKKLLNNSILSFYDINNFWTNLALNIEYLNSRIDSSNKIKYKINSNLSKFIIDNNQLLINLSIYNKNHDLTESDEKLYYNNKINSNLYCNIKCYDCWTKNILSNFIYLLLITAKFIGSGECKDPNLIKLSEYYSNIFFTFLKLNDITKKILSNELKNDFFDNYIDYKNRLNYSLLELNFNSDTIDEIITYLDEIIMLNLI